MNSVLVNVITGSIILISNASWAGRRIETVLHTAGCETRATSSYDSKVRIRAHFRNLSDRSQTLKVIFQDLSYVASAAFDTDAKAQAQLPGWSKSVENWRTISGVIPNATRSFTLPPRGRWESTVSIQCFYANAKRECILTDAEQGASCTSDIIYVANDTRFSLRVEIDEDRGAVVGSFYVQNLCSKGPCNPSHSYEVGVANYPINGGRPF